ncbi:caffeic acid 3-O-methyltransferase 1-like [Pyrus communis]|uniref:caffeic acid 3-O-methyltransferase 1-like n=1 Tax=Pyrus communis TaxID=23211 RepID=UPI0035BF369F
MLDRILKLLASHSILSCSVVGDDGDHKSLKRLYSLTPVSKHYVTNEAGVSFGPVLLMLQDKIFTESWYQMKNAIIEGGIPFEMAHGSHAFKYAGYDQRFNQAFNTGMNNTTTMLVKKILEGYKGFENLKKVVDVGGGLGVAISLITATYPHIKCINYDLPHVVKDAPKYPGVEHVGGDMFASIPDADAVFMKGILHDWFDEDCIKLLKNCYKALPMDGKVIVVDAVLSNIPNSSSITKSNFHLDVHMMVQTPGGKQRSAEEFMDLATAAGFSGIKLACFAAHFGVVEFYK